MMHKQFLSIAITLFVFFSPVFGRDLIIDNDSAVDDVIATTLHLTHAPESVKAITVAPANCYALPAAWVMLQLKELFLPASMNIPLGVGTNEGINLFPSIWREDAWKLAHMSLWENNNELKSFSLEKIPSALEVLTKALTESTSPIDILATGPCTNIAQVLNASPELASKINRIFIMGGALYINGNVEETGHDGSAEWNIYNNPQAFLDVLRSNVAITLVPLDATEYASITPYFMNQLEKNRAVKRCQLVYESSKLITGECIFWDTLTSAVIINPAIIKTKKININVSLEGPSMGRTFEDAHGFEVDVAVWADRELFEKTVLDILLK